MIRDLTILALAAFVIALVVRDRRREVAARRVEAARNHPSRADSLPVARGFAAGDAAYLALPADPAAPVYTDLLADYEAARADWTEPGRWSR